MNSLSIVIPTYNEALRLKPSLEKIQNYLATKHWQSEIIISDDGSTDETIAIAKHFPSIRIFSNPHRGKGSAIKHGINEAKKDWILFMDADSAISIENLEIFYPFIGSHDILIGSKSLPESKLLNQQPIPRTLARKILHIAIQSIIPGIHDTQCGFKLFKRDIVQKIFSLQTINGFGFDAEILFIARKYGFSILEVPVTWRHDSDSKVRPFRDGLRILFDLGKIQINNLQGKYSSKEKL